MAVAPATRSEQLGAKHYCFEHTTRFLVLVLPPVPLRIILQFGRLRQPALVQITSALARSTVMAVTSTATDALTESEPAVVAASDDTNAAAIKNVRMRALPRSAPISAK